MAQKFNEILGELDIAPAGVILVRHTDGQLRQTIYEAALRRDSNFDDYQESQSNGKLIAAIDRASHLASFVVDSSGETVFGGMWKIGGRRDPAGPDGPVNPFKTPSAMTGVRFMTQRLEVPSSYFGKVVIEWGPGKVQWWQWAATKDKDVIKVRS